MMMMSGAESFSLDFNPENVPNQIEKKFDLFDDGTCHWMSIEDCLSFSDSVSDFDSDSDDLIWLD